MGVVGTGGVFLGGLYQNLCYTPWRWNSRYMRVKNSSIVFFGLLYETTGHTYNEHLLVCSILNTFHFPDT